MRILSSSRNAALVGLFLAGMLSAAPAGVRADPIDDYVLRQMKRQHVPGLALAVLDRGRIVKVQAYGFADLESSTPATPHTVFQLASVTKQFTATAILLLAQERRLSLDDRLDGLIDGVPPAWRTVTVRQLLNHTSGLPDYLRGPLGSSCEDTTPQKILEGISARPLEFAPGTSFAYSNTNYLLLALVIRHLTGRDYDAYLADRVFGPLEMNATRRDDPAEVIADRASGYTWVGDRWMHSVFLNPTQWNNGDGGILSSVLDLARWEAALQGDSILTGPSKREMWTPLTLPDGRRNEHGLGWGLVQVRGHPVAEVNGGRPGTATNFARYLDDGMTIILLMNSGADMGRISRGVARQYIPSLGFAPAAGAAADTSRLAVYTGRYEFRNNFMLTIEQDGGRLVERFPGRGGGDWLPGPSATFYSEDLPVEMRFERDASGAVTGLVWKSEEETRRAPRIGPLVHDVAAQPDPDPARTRAIASALQAFELGGAAVEELPAVTPDARRDFANGVRSLSGIASVSFLAVQDVAGRGIERHQALVDRVLYYRLSRGAAAAPANSCVLVYLTGDGRITDVDVVTD